MSCPSAAFRGFSRRFPLWRASHLLPDVSSLLSTPPTAVSSDRRPLVQFVSRVTGATERDRKRRGERRRETASECRQAYRKVFQSQPTPCRELVTFSVLSRPRVSRSRSDRPESGASFVRFAVRLTAPVKTDLPFLLRQICQPVTVSHSIRETHPVPSFLYLMYALVSKITCNRVGSVTASQA